MLLALITIGVAIDALSIIIWTQVVPVLIRIAEGIEHK